MGIWTLSQQFVVNLFVFSILCFLFSILNTFLLTNSPAVKILLFLRRGEIWNLVQILLEAFKLKVGVPPWDKISYGIWMVVVSFSISLFWLFAPVVRIWTLSQQLSVNLFVYSTAPEAITSRNDSLMDRKIMAYL